jgi:aminoglycoside/choline kinase family phosphotransferase
MPFLKNSLERQQVDGVSVNNNLEIQEFLIGNQLSNFKLSKLPGDASKRSYYRVYTSGQTHILMDSSQEISSMLNFIKINKHLDNYKIRVPKIIAEDAIQGLLLLEDFGNYTLKRYLLAHADNYMRLYPKAVSILQDILTIPNKIDLPRHDTKKLHAELELFLDWYVKSLLPMNLFVDARLELKAIFSHLYQYLPSLGEALVLKDFMADNIMVIPKDDDQLGILDFQDALYGYRGYDLVSLLQDARLEVPHEIEQQCIAQYLKSIPDISYAKFWAKYNILGIHRNLRIIGCFYRLAKAMGKNQYLDFVPLVWKYINKNLEHEALADVKNWFKRYGLSNNARFDS